MEQLTAIPTIPLHQVLDPLIKIEKNWFRDKHSHTREQLVKLIADLKEEQRRYGDYSDENILAAACKVFNVLPQEALERNMKRLLRRNGDVVAARQMTVYLIRKLSGKSLQRTGQIFGYNHSTVIHCCKTVEGYLQIDKEYRERVSSCLAWANLTTDEHGKVTVLV
jgi:chromosomal replication initiation ATPase DnaA